MIYYMIMHKETGEIMPELKRTRGYSHWNPSKVNTSENLKKKLLGTPRLFRSIRHAKRCIHMWNSTPNGRMGSYQSSSGEYEDDIRIRADGRKKEDLQIVIVDLTVTGVVE